jgi:hypothetical protein
MRPIRIKFLIVLIGVLVQAVASAQTIDKTADMIDVNAGVGKSRGSFSVAFFRMWKFGKERRIGIGTGLRYTGFAGANIYYITAPAELTSGSTSPLILFRENIVENIDSVLLKSPLVNSLNLAINLDYRVSQKVTIGFNIDAIGVSFGKKTAANYINGYEGKITTAHPADFNVLLISDNDRGSLNSEFYLKYFLNDKWAIKLGGQFLFTEYITREEVQQLPEPNDRFRNKALLLTCGFTYKL